MKNELLDNYLKDISKYKILNPSEINKLIPLAQQGDQLARDKIVLSNLRFVVSIAKQFQNRGIPLIDLINSGNTGLIHAIDKFDLSKEVTFLTYAVWWIKQAIYSSIYWQGKVIRLPMSQQTIVFKILKATHEFSQEHDRTPSIEELSKLTDIPIDKIEYLSQFSNKLISVDDYVGNDEEGNKVCDIIPDESESIDEIADNYFINLEISKALDKLTVREHDLLRMFYGIGVKKFPNKLICQMFGVCNERIRQMKEGALAKLRRLYSKRLSNLL